MDKIKEADLFATDPQFTVMGLETISNWKTKLATLIILCVAFGVSFSTIKGMWTPVSELPITTSFISTDQIIDPFIIGFIYNNLTEIGKIKVYYLNQSLEYIECPANLQNQNTECFITPSVNLTSNSIRISSSAYETVLLYLQTFSINNILSNQSQNTYQQILGSGGIISINVKQLLLQNSVIPRSSKLYTGIQFDSFTSVALVPSFDSQASEITETLILLSGATSSVRYQIKRVTFLSVVSTFITWMQTLSSIASAVVIVNIFIMKSHLITKLYQSRHIENKWLMVKMWVYDIFEAVCLASIARKCGFFKKQYLIARSFRQMDQKLSLDVILRIMDYNKEIDQDSKSEEELLDFDYTFKDDVQYTKHVALQQILPVQQKGFIQRTLSSLSMNPIKVKLISKKSEKSSLFSIIITFVAISVIIPFLIYFGALDHGPLVSTKTQLRKQLSFQFNNNTNIYIDIFSQNFTNSEVKYNGSITFRILDKNYNTIDSITAYRDCKHNHTSDGSQTSSFCLPRSLRIQKNSVLNINTQLAILINITNNSVFSKVELKFVNYALKPNQVEQYLRTESIDIIESRILLATLKLIEKDDRGQKSQLYEISPFAEIPSPIQLSEENQLGFIIQLSKQFKIFKVNSKMILSYLKNIWGLNYVLFTLLLTFVIFPYNNKIAKSNFVSKISRQSKKQVNQPQVLESNIEISNTKLKEEAYEIKEKKIFSVQNMLQLLYSKFWSLKPSLPYIKKKI